ncbi:4Fe-4S ferredoxin iron-sulfur binding domain protein [Ammonifex degensii KC4]|uniref:4Fe-4S ferredoxin iron-sulfur binding domain protein n=1 Tax=Ammonifex degensii (strain DSM 10501 / KC4) TaxID=429009 RepID=C9R7N1_AMMDK|nr:4Fe-4S dicluster domain-containing protein [Ammonifex degensii]ACX52310.1 4Fe-4S ferredoxin iron-sulfur binding domain protein [Ammonifex degensii KC4]
MSYALLFDVTKCIGCRACQVACKEYNRLPLDDKRDRRYPRETWDKQAPLTANTWLRINAHLVEKDGRVEWRFVRRSCFHCQYPACESACFAHAFYKTPEGPVLYHAYRCVGCRYCMLACPFGIPKYQWNEVFPEVRKCIMCYKRVNQGAPPACVGACPTGAITFGDRDAMLNEAHRRIEESPERYVNYVYGEKEVGGTSLFYISDVPFEKLGLPTIERGEIGTEPIPHITHRVLKWTLPIAFTWGAVLTALYFATRQKGEEGH